MNNKLYEYIKNYTLKEEKTCDKNVTTRLLQLLTKRIIDAKITYLLLIDNKRSTDAILIAGHILELAAGIVYIKNGKHKEKNTLKYINKSTLQCLFSLFRNESFAESPYLKNDIKCMLSTLSNDGDLVIKKRLSKIDTEKKQINSCVLNALKDEKLSCDAKTTLIENFYELPRVSDYLNHLYKYMSKSDEIKKLPKIQQPESLFGAFYDKYCQIKHASPFCCYFDETTSKIKDFDQDVSIPAVAYSLAIIRE